MINRRKFLRCLGLAPAAAVVAIALPKLAEGKAAPFGKTHDMYMHPVWHEYHYNGDPMDFMAESGHPAKVRRITANRISLDARKAV